MRHACGATLDVGRCVVQLCPFQLGAIFNNVPDIWSQAETRASPRALHEI